MKEQIQFIRALYSSLNKAANLYMANGGTGDGANHMDKNHGKTAIKRKITLLRQELLNKEKFCPSCGAKMDLEDDNGT